MNDKKEMLKKLRALALRGIDGEKEQAQAILEKLMKKYDITFGELDEEELNEYEFEFHGKEQKVLLRQTIYKVTNDRSSMWGFKYTDTGRTCKTR